MTKDLQAGIDAFLSVLQSQYDTLWTSEVTKVIFERDGNGQNFQRIVFSRPGGGDKSVVGFVALRDGKTKTLGQYKEGDIFMANGYTQPAKHVRGNVYEDNGVHATNGRGNIRYLK